MFSLDAHSAQMSAYHVINAMTMDGLDIGVVLIIDVVNVSKFLIDLEWNSVMNATNLFVHNARMAITN